MDINTIVKCEEGKEHDWRYLKGADTTSTLLQCRICNRRIQYSELLQMSLIESQNRNNKKLVYATWGLVIVNILLVIITIILNKISCF